MKDVLDPTKTDWLTDIVELLWDTQPMFLLGGQLFRDQAQIENLKTQQLTPDLD
jgi:hypothetical protein